MTWGEWNENLAPDDDAAGAADARADDLRDLMEDTGLLDEPEEEDE